MLGSHDTPGRNRLNRNIYGQPPPPGLDMKRHTTLQIIRTAEFAVGIPKVRLWVALVRLCRTVTRMIVVWRMKKKLWESPLHTRVYHKNTFFRNKISPTRQASAWGLVWRNPKGFLISTKFRGSSSHFRFDQFHIVDFHSALTFLDWDPFAFLQTNPQADAWRVGLNLFLKKVFFGTP